jgi:hypothetical protein
VATAKQKLKTVQFMNAHKRFVLTLLIRLKHGI